MLFSVPSISQLTTLLSLITSKCILFAQNQFILDNVWQPFENYDPAFVWAHIEDAAISTHVFIRDRFSFRN